MMKPLCTVFSDASYSIERQRAGWAVWLKCGGQKWTGYAPFKDLPRDHLTAELYAAINGVCAAVRLFAPTHIHLVSDCKYVLQRLGGGHPVREWEEGAFAIYEAQTDGVLVTLKHVKAHTNLHRKDVQPRAFVNDWCDRHARKAMQKGVRG